MLGEMESCAGMDFPSLADGFQEKDVRFANRKAPALAALQAAA
jgi:hypothetical protein